jgi:hypothetical protein
MTDQTFQPNPTDPTQTTIPSQGGVFGGFVGVEEVATPKIPDSSVLFDDRPQDSEPIVEDNIPTNPVVEEIPAVEFPVEEINSFEQLNLNQTDTSSEFFTEEPVAPEQTPAPIQQEITPVEEPTPVEEIAPVVDIPTEQVISEEIVAAPIVEPTETAPVSEVSDVKAKYNELANNIVSLKNGSQDAIQIVGSNTDAAHVEYVFSKEDEIIEVTRTELNKETDESSDNVIAFVADADDGQIQVFLDDTLLFEEQELLEDPKKKMQVMEKINKFIFLTSEKLKDVEKARKAQEAELQEKRRLQDIFRNF